MRGTLKAIAVPGAHLSEQNLFDLQRSLSTVSEILHFFKLGDGDSQQPYPNLARLAAAMQSFPDIVTEISRVLDKNGNIKDNASPLLQELRQAIARATASINGLMRKVINAGRQDGYLDKDTTPSMRDGRLVIPISPMHITAAGCLPAISFAACSAKAATSSADASALTCGNGMSSIGTIRETIPLLP